MHCCSASKWLPLRRVSALRRIVRRLAVSYKPVARQPMGYNCCLQDRVTRMTPQAGSQASAVHQMRSSGDALEARYELMQLLSGVGAPKATGEAVAMSGSVNARQACLHPTHCCPMKHAVELWPAFKPANPEKRWTAGPDTTTTIVVVDNFN